MISYKDSDVDTKLNTNFLKIVKDYYDTNDNFCFINKENYSGILLKQSYNIRRSKAHLAAFIEACEDRGYTYLWISDALCTVSSGFITLEDGTEFPAPNAQNDSENSFKMHLDDIQIFDVDCWLAVIKDAADDLYDTMMNDWSTCTLYDFRQAVEREFGCWIYVPHSYPKYNINPSPREKRELLQLAITHHRMRKYGRQEKNQSE